MKKLFSVLAVLFSVFLISCSTNTPEEEKKSDINVDINGFYATEPSLPTLVAPPIVVTPPIVVKVSLDLEHYYAHEMCNNCIKIMDTHTEWRTTIKNGLKIKELATVNHQDNIYECKYCHKQFRVCYHTSDYAKSVLEDMKKACSARPKEKSNE